MSNFDIFEGIVEKYLEENGLDIEFITNLHESSLSHPDQTGSYYLYNGDKELNVINMDLIAKNGYKIAKHALGENNNINTVDAFLINQKNEWYFIEFKDAKISSMDHAKNDVLKKAYSNLYMVLDILYSMSEINKRISGFTYEQPIKFAQQQVYYILVCSEEKNPNLYREIKDHFLAKEKYTPPFMQRLKDYIFKDAYAYTETFFEKEFVNKFQY